MLVNSQMAARMRSRADVITEVADYIEGRVRQQLDGGELKSRAVYVLAFMRAEAIELRNIADESDAKRGA